jgi:hypothetical protein
MAEKKEGGASVNVTEHILVKEDVVQSIFKAYYDTGKAKNVPEAEDLKALAEPWKDSKRYREFFGSDLVCNGTTKGIPGPGKDNADAYNTVAGDAFTATDQDLMPGGLKEAEVDAIRKIRTAYGEDPKEGPLGMQGKKGFPVLPDNILSPPPDDPEWIKFMRHMLSGFAILLEVGSALCFLAYGLDNSSQDNLYLGIVLISVVTLNAIFCE